MDNPIIFISGLTVATAILLAAARLLLKPKKEEPDSLVSEDTTIHYVETDSGWKKTDRSCGSCEHYDKRPGDICGRCGDAHIDYIHGGGTDKTDPKWAPEWKPAVQENGGYGPHIGVRKVVPSTDELDTDRYQASRAPTETAPIRKRARCFRAK